MRVFVINRPEDAERRASAQEKLDAAGIAFEFFDAISGEAAVRRRLFHGYDESEFLLNTGRKIAPGEIGCFASHRDLWMLSVELNESIMIMEDDFDLLDRFAEALQCCEDVIDEIGFLRLQFDSRAACKYPIAAYDTFMVSRYTKAPHCTMCYGISPEVAGQFLDQTRTMDAPVDIFIKKYWAHGQPLYALTPFAVAPSLHSVDSTIQGREKQRKPLIVAVRRFLRKGAWYLLRWQFNMRHRYQQSMKGATAVARAAPRETIPALSVAERSTAR